MLGAIIGDIVGSVYEFHNIKTKDFPLFGAGCHVTDDSILTLAVAEALMEGGETENFVTALKQYARAYPQAGYGGRFRQWVQSADTRPYGSCGNGSAMRVSPCGWLMDCGFTARTGMWPSNGRAAAERSAAVTHDHPEGIKGALAVADAIFICRIYAGKWCSDYGTPLVASLEDCKRQVKDHLETEYGYDLSRTLAEIRPTYRFDATCQGSVPQAVTAFLESDGFEDAVRNAVSLGGDSDTLAAITGSIAEAAYGIPSAIHDRALTYLDDRLLDVYRRWQKFLKEYGIAYGKQPVF